MMPFLRYREQVRKLSNVLLLELEQLVAGVRTYLATQHAEDGTHGAVTATSVTVGDVTVTDGVVTFTSITAPSNGAATSGQLFVRYNGAKYELCVIFGSGAVQVIATEP